MLLYIDSLSSVECCYCQLLFYGLTRVLNNANATSSRSGLAGHWKVFYWFPCHSLHVLTLVVNQTHFQVSSHCPDCCWSGRYAAIQYSIVDLIAYIVDVESIPGGCEDFIARWLSVLDAPGQYQKFCCASTFVRGLGGIFRPSYYEWTSSLGILLHPISSEKFGNLKLRFQRL